jgi:hypothetical protein
MEKKASHLGENTTNIVNIDEKSLEETQVAEQLYHNAGLDPVVDAGLRDYDERIQLDNKLINKVLGPRESDIKGYGEAVAKRVAFAVYALLNKQYGGKVGDLRSYIMTLEEERNQAKEKYDELMGRVVGILGEEYKELRTDSKTFMEKLTTTLGEDLKGARIDHEALAEKLADIDGLRKQIQKLTKEKEQLKERHKSQTTSLKNEHGEEVGKLKSQIAGLELKVKDLEVERTALSDELTRLRSDGEQLKSAMNTVDEAIPYDEIKNSLAAELHTFLLKDSKVPGMVIDGVGKFIDLKKYLGMAAERGAREASQRVQGKFKETFTALS